MFWSTSKSKTLIPSSEDAKRSNSGPTIWQGGHQTALKAIIAFPSKCWLFNSLCNNFLYIIFSFIFKLVSSCKNNNSISFFICVKTVFIFNFYINIEWNTTS
ncbi:Uncharacterised protein [Chlamydia trachomatis]|nr:Uncharacterised protein [Chlamydia trachomatis]